MSEEAEVRAAGGVVRNADGHVLVVHRPSYDDWSLPKGKLHDGETWHAAAVREIHEETGVIARMGAEMTPTRYRDKHDRDKVVRWWTMTAVDIRPRAPDDEVDQVRWVPPDQADRLLTYASDRALVAEAAARQAQRTVLVVRHADAASRSGWNGDDGLRPLTGLGQRQARGLVGLLAPWHVTSLVSSPLTRCVQTLEPLATRHGLQVRHDGRLAEGADRADVWGLLAEVPTGTVLCSHGDVIGTLVEELADDGVVGGAPTWSKGSTWVVTLDGARAATAASYLEAPS